MHRPALVLMVLALPLIVLADDSDPLKAEQAAQKVGEKVTVEFEVKSTGQSRNQKLTFLNSEANHRNEKNFTIVIEPAAEEKFTKAGILDIRAHYKNKTIRVTGTVSVFEKKPQIKVAEPGQIVIVEKK